MRIILCFLTSVLIIISCKQKDKKQTGGEAVVTENINRGDSSLLTDSTWGWVNAFDNIDNLKKLFGDANIKDERICGPECADSIDVTLVYPGSTKEFIVYWRDSAYHKQIEMLRCYTAGSPYHTANGIKLGLTLDELLKINGKPISFYGFGWDYGGGIMSLHEGVLEKSTVRFNLDLPEDPVGDNAVYGEKELSSEDLAVKKLLGKILVSELFLSFRRIE